MFDDHDTDDFGPAEEFSIPDNVNPARLTSMSDLRDMALIAFDKHIEEISGGINPDVQTATLEEKKRFLTLAEVEHIVREFSVAENNQIIAVTANSLEEAQNKMRQLLAALMTRIQENVMTAAAGQDLIDVCFDDEANKFAFRVSEKGFKFVEEHGAAVFPNWPDDDQDDDQDDDSEDTDEE